MEAFHHLTSVLFENFSGYIYSPAALMNENSRLTQNTRRQLGFMQDSTFQVRNFEQKSKRTQAAEIRKGFLWASGNVEDETRSRQTFPPWSTFSAALSKLTYKRNGRLSHA